ncbi:thiamine-phosphate kinase [Arthrobacter crystallopoietes]|uniref:Thiamine-monophosphate kinase n=1 Tax=Crystallibacter crystallopoietes TaxID=37928 RepID=A0A1H1G343_9MICC|nr:thiamine-phosphate kinase [Arthrobacter crystallopoietes]AUI52786.1 thiamine-phosphate kinase [Arthrobacter crystallopoietes]SDR07662.1 thiamine-phosphate kinase [Arthrobacter crystallopoietes]
MAEHHTVAQLDERALLERIFPRLGTADVPVGPGDDAAVIEAPDGRTVISIDTLVQDQDFRLEWASGYRSSGFDVGWKCAAQNVSDINAMGAVPTSLVISLTLPGNTPVRWVEDMADGLRTALHELGAERCAVVGGDLGRGAVLVVTAAVTGDLQGRAPVLRSGARPGDVVAVGGSLGRAAAGLALLEGTSGYGGMPPELQALAAAQSRPLPPLALGPRAAQAGAHAMMDISDGLIRDAGRLARASGAALALDYRRLDHFEAPLRQAALMLGADPRHWVLGGGEDHGLLAVFPPAAGLPEGFVHIGSVAEAAACPAEVTVDGEVPDVLGWDHFKG